MKRALPFLVLVACGAKEAVIFPADGSTDAPPPGDGSSSTDAQAETSTMPDGGTCNAEAGAPNFPCGNVECDFQTQYCLVKGHTTATCEPLTCECSKKPDCNCVPIPCMGGMCQVGGAGLPSITIACP